MARYSTILRDQNEVPISGAVVSVINPTTGALASLTDDLSVTLQNPFTTNVLGDVTFNAADNVYRLEYRVNGIERRIDDVIVGSPSAFAGPAGPAFATYFTLANFKAGPISNAVQILQASGIAAGLFYWETANAPYTADNVNVIKADSTALSVGAWVRQTAFAATRAALAARAAVAGQAAVLTEGKRAGTFVFDASNLSAAVTADTQQGMYVAPASAASGASGAWKRIPVPHYNTYVAEWFGVDPDAVDNSAAMAGLFGFIRYLGDSVRKAVQFAGGATYYTDGDTWTLQQIPSLTMIEGIGGKARLEHRNSTASPRFFETANKSNVTFRNLHLVGNGTGSGEHIKFTLTSGAAADVENLFVDNCIIENCSTVDGYVTFEITSTSKSMVNVGSRGGLVIISATGNTPNADRPNTALIHPGVYFYTPPTAGATGKFKNLLLVDTVVNGEFLKQGILVQGAAENVKIVRPRILSVGKAAKDADIANGNTANQGGGFYGLALYRQPDALLPSDGFLIDNPYITNAYDNGIYIQSCKNGIICDPVISGQTATVDASLARAAIHLNGGYNITIENPQLSGNFRHIVVQGNDGLNAPTECNFAVLGGVLTGATASTSVAIRVGPGYLNSATANNMQIWSGLRVVGTKIRGAKYGIYYDTGDVTMGASSVLFEDVDIQADYDATSAAVVHGDTGNVTPASNHRYVHCRFQGTDYGVRYARRITGGGLLFERCTFEAGSTTNDLIVQDGQIRLEMLGNDIKSTTANKVSPGVPGDYSRAEGNTFPSSTNPVVATHLMRALPAWNGGHGHFVQDAGVVEAGSASSKYRRKGWGCDGGTTWLEERTLTGN